MNSIYFEILDHLFNYLDLQTKLKCRLINKHWLYFIDHYLNLKNITFYNDVYYDKEQFNKLETNQVINNLNLISNINLNLIIDKLDFNNFYYFNSNKIKVLGLYYLNCLNIVKLLNKFNKIIKLNIGFMIECDNLINELNLELQNIEILSLVLIRNKNSKIICNLPKLRNIKIDSDQLIQLIIKYPNSIEYLNLNFNYNISEFRNLKILYLNNLSSFNDNLLNSIINLKQLKEIHSNNYLLIKHFYDLNLDKFIKIFYIGINFDNLNHILKSKFNNLFKFYFNNYNRLESKILFLNNLEFDKLEPYYNQLPKEFLSKFNLNEIIIKENINDEDKFLNFIKDCEHFKSLLIYNPTISNNLIKRLTQICPFIIELTLGNQCTVDGNYNDEELKQILKFKYLKKLTISQNISIELIELFFNELKYLKFMETKQCLNSYHNIQILDYNHFVYTKFNLKILNDEDVYHFKNWRILIDFIQSNVSIIFQLKYNNHKSQLEYYSTY